MKAKDIKRRGEFQIKVVKEHYNEMWNYIHILERELIKKGMKIQELDKLRNDIFTI